jgi:glycosyltransferase involved in cell wall biosynthesis
MSKQVRTVVVNFQTPDLLKETVESFRKYYPQSPLLIIDNGSKDNSKDVIEQMRQISPIHTNVLLLEENTFHGPAMHRAMRIASEEFVFFLDSDTQTKQGGFLEAMQTELETSVNAYAIGRQMIVNKRGFPASKGITVLVPAYMMIRRNMYSNLAPFEHHGFPVMKNFLDAQRKGYTLKLFPVEEFIEHRWRGTASRFGYGLGWRGKKDFVLNKIGL